MAYIKKTKKIKTRSKTERRAKRTAIYNNSTWRDMRRGHLMAFPLCEVCAARGITTLASDVHHRDSFMHYEGGAALNVAFDASNLVSVCKPCHSWLHRHHHDHGLNIEWVTRKMNEECGQGCPPNMIKL